MSLINLISLANESMILLDSKIESEEGSVPIRAGASFSVVGDRIWVAGGAAESFEYYTNTTHWFDPGKFPFV
jgi:hypothetical protein